MHCEHPSIRSPRMHAQARLCESIVAVQCPSMHRRITLLFRPSLDSTSPVTMVDFGFWYDVRSTLERLIDGVVTLNDIESIGIKSDTRTIVKLCLPQPSTIHRRKRRTTASIALQTSLDGQQRRNIKVQTNTVTLSPLAQRDLLTSTLFFS